MLGIFDFFMKKQTKSASVVDESLSNEIESSKDTAIISNNYEPEINKEEFIVVHTGVSGITFNNRKKKLNAIVKEYIKWNSDPEFSYEGYDSNEDILGFFEGDKLYQYVSEMLPYVRIVPEPENEYDEDAKAIYISSDSEKWEHIGYIPKKDNNRLRHLFDKAELYSVEGEIKGGKYKYIDTDEEGDEKVRIATEDYNLVIHLTFLKKD